MLRRNKSYLINKWKTNKLYFITLHARNGKEIENEENSYYYLPIERAVDFDIQ